MIVNVAKTVVIDSNGQVLLLRRGSTAPTRPDTWDFPGGGVEPGETFEQGAIREASEEAGLILTDLSLVYAATEYVEKHKHSVNRALFVARINAVAPTPTLSFEHSEYKWVDIDMAPEEFPHPFYGDGLQYALDHQLIAV